MTAVVDREHATAADTDTAAGFVVHVDVLRTLLAGALVAASKDDMLPAITAVQLDWDADGITAASTDRYRLAVGRIGWDARIVDALHVAGRSAVPSPGAVLLARRDVETIIKALPKPTRTNAAWTYASVELTAAGVLVRHGMYGSVDGSLTFVALDAQFPKWRTLIPTDESLSEGAMPLVVNPAYLADVAKLAPSKNAPVRIRTSAAYRPAVLDFPQSADDASVVQWLYLLMPVRLG